MIEVKQIPATVAASIIDDELFDRISNSRCTKEHVATSYDDSNVYIGAFIDGAIIGAVTFNPESSSTVEIHCNFIKEFRSQAEEAGRMIISEFMRSFPTVFKFKALIPVTYPDVIGFSKKFGFVEEGLDRKSILKGGIMVDRIYLGATREEIEAVIYGRS